MKHLAKWTMIAAAAAGMAASAQAETSVGFTVPAGKLQIASVPFVNPSSEDGAFKFGDLEIASDLGLGSSVLFWDVARQKWSGGAKSARGWAAAQANRVIAPGEGFFVQSPAAGTWEAVRPYASAVPPASGGGRP